MPFHPLVCKPLGQNGQSFRAYQTAHYCRIFQLCRAFIGLKHYLLLVAPHCFFQLQRVSDVA